MAAGKSKLEGRAPSQRQESPHSRGPALFHAVTVHRVCERMPAEEDVRESEERLRLTIDAAPIGMALVSLDDLGERPVHADEAAVERR